jgi:transcriptional regulator with XRE-family HTH domain
MDTGNQLGEYLRTRRELLTPDDVGLPNNGRRRVHRLRREEAAILAGISTEFYLRLELGHEKNPSEQVLESLALAFQLNANETATLHRIAHPTTGRRRREDPKPEQASDSLSRLIETWTGQAVIVQSRLMDVLASNALARAITPQFTPGENSLRSAFLDPSAPELHRDWNEATARIIVGLRALTGPEIDDPKLTQIVRELSLRSERFRQLWSQNEVHGNGDGTMLLRHPLVGDLDLRQDTFLIDGTDGQVLIVLHADAGSATETALRRLAAIARGEKAAESERPLAEPVSIESKRRAT